MSARSGEDVAPKVYRCEHGEPVATRYPSGTWVGHDRCLRCRWRKFWRPTGKHYPSLMDRGRRG